MSSGNAPRPNPADTIVLVVAVPLVWLKEADAELFALGLKACAVEPGLPYWERIDVDAVGSKLRKILDECDRTVHRSGFGKTTRRIIEISAERSRGVADPAATKSWINALEQAFGRRGDRFLAPSLEARPALWQQYSGSPLCRALYDLVNSTLTVRGHPPAAGGPRTPFALLSLQDAEAPTSCSHELALPGNNWAEVRRSLVGESARDEVQASTPAQASESVRTTSVRSEPVKPTKVVLSSTERVELERRCDPRPTSTAQLDEIGQALHSAQALSKSQGQSQLTPFAIAEEEMVRGTDVWFLGDIHGDVRALEAGMLVAEKVSGDRPIIMVFLGDLVDDGPDSQQVVLRVMQRWLRDPQRTWVIAGNHDEALEWRASERRFVAAVDPCSYCDWLEDPSRSTDERLTGRVFTHFVRSAPRAILFPDGLLAVHGGVPHVDLHSGIRNRESLESEDCLRDFVWLRIAPRAPRRVPNRSNRSCELGVADVEAFCQVAEVALGRPVRRLIRGHDHLEDRYGVFPAYTRTPVLTINTMSRRLPREMTGPTERTPCVARWKRDAIPEVYQVVIVPDATEGQPALPPGSPNL